MNIRTVVSLIPLALLGFSSSSNADQLLVDEVARTFIEEHWQLDPTYYEIEILSRHISPVTNADQTLSLRPLTQGEPIGLFTLMAEIKDGERLVERGQIRTRVRRFDNVFVALDRIKRNRNLQESNFELKRMEITSLREQPVEEIGNISDYRSKRNLSRGQILTNRSIEPVPDIDVGGEVVISLKQGMLEISAPGRVMQRGQIGQTVKVKNLSSGKILRARIIDSRTVEILR